MLKFGSKATLALEVQQLSNIVAEIDILGFTREGIFKFFDTHDGDNTILTTSFGIADIPIMLTVSTRDVAVQRGEYFVTVFLTINGERVMKLCAGYVSRHGAIAFPAIPNADSISGRGIIRSVLGTDPAAGAEVNETVPVGVAWLLHAIAITYVTDGNSATREPKLQITDGTNVLMEFPASGTQSLSETRGWFWIRRGARESATSSGERHGDLPTDIILPAGFEINTLDEIAQAGDNWGAPRLTVEEWKVATT